jgi:hypothetical protein
VWQEHGRCERGTEKERTRRRTSTAVSYSPIRWSKIFLTHSAEEASSFPFGGDSFLTCLAKSAAERRKALTAEISSEGISLLLSMEKVLRSARERVSTGEQGR